MRNLVPTMLKVVSLPLEKKTDKLESDFLCKHNSCILRTKDAQAGQLHQNNQVINWW